MQIFASLLRSCAFLALTTGSLGQSGPASALEELRVEFREINEVLRNENALKFEEVKNELEEVKNENAALRLELDDIRNLFQTQPRRTFENNFADCMSQDNSGDIYFTGCNVHIRSGAGSTAATPNGKGNLIIGYNEPDPVNPVESSRVGSHNLVIGGQHEYTSYSGIVTGHRSKISNKYSAVVGGTFNSATGEYSTVTGGLNNDASGEFSSISGGEANTASGLISSISGGDANTASGLYSSVLGGRTNYAQGVGAVVTGGQKNRAIGDQAVVVGGKKNKARMKFSVVTGA
eukprot:CAMPEP_0194279400 /NCGR_PEP_ID=MMETSP0169-20130528/13907_1 /TAXON_ID=218684 /ORGANISM="Corethron pennatum, Strain L29A3" /LENGTH=290 /DNA_ID=CAMNT_0039023817 /DNA_START=57 /DNA_END=929 /DNA_ORIENTATION=-